MALPSIFRSALDHWLVRGLLVGFAATEALDWTSIALYDNESRGLRLRENRTRHFRHAYETAVVRIADAIGRSLTRREMHTWGWRFHKVFGVLGGLSYVAMRRRYPAVGAGLGLAYGIGFFLLGDEVMVPAFGLTPGPTAFSWKVHARGAIAHVAYGVAAEATYRLLDAASATMPIATEATTPLPTEGSSEAPISLETPLAV